MIRHPFQVQVIPLVFEIDLVVAPGAVVVASPRWHVRAIPGLPSQGRRLKT
jgi:hypothetical protein